MMTSAQFKQWFAEEAAGLAEADPAHAAERIQAVVEQVLPGVGVEVGIEERGHELIISAGGAPDRFDLVEELCVGLSAPRWTITALKPPRGFEFSFEAGGRVVDAKVLAFEPLESPQRRDALGIRLLAPPEMVSDVRDVAWTVLETGIGERAVAAISHVEVAPCSEEGRREAISIADLQRYIEWHVARRGTVN